MSKTNFHGKPVSLKGQLPKQGAQAPDFTFVKSDLSEGSLNSLGDKKKVIIALPSLDTGVCQTETRKFNEQLADRDDVVGMVVSKDLPFAMKRFCETDGIKNVQIGSDFRGNFTSQYNTEMTEGPLKGLSSRAVFVLDGQNKIHHVQLTNDVTDEPDYDAVMKAVDAI